jgi:membrane protein YqaA with SNARE-associated domain
MLKGLYNKLIRLSGHRHAPLALAAIAFAESSFFPIPPDVLLIPMILADRRKAFFYAAIATLASVAGGYLGYAIGDVLYESIGRHIIAAYHLQAAFERFQSAFGDYAFWVIVVKGLTPIPFKLVTIACGVAKINLLTFTIACIICRSLRFFLEAGLLWKFGPPIRDFIETRLMLVTSLFAAALVAGVVAVLVF